MGLVTRGCHCWPTGARSGAGPGRLRQSPTADPCLKAASCETDALAVQKLRRGQATILHRTAESSRGSRMPFAKKDPDFLRSSLLALRQRQLDIPRDQGLIISNLPELMFCAGRPLRSLHTHAYACRCSRLLAEAAAD